MNMIAVSNAPQPPYTGTRLIDLIHRNTGSNELAHNARVVSQLLPFKVSQYAANHLIDWKQAPNDPFFRLLIPHKEMLLEEDFYFIEQALDDKPLLQSRITQLRQKLNPHPGGQLNLNVPNEFAGMQHKYRETLLVFPKQSQTCHAYCSYCFRWPQFIGDKTLQIAMNAPQAMVEYLKRHPEVTDVLITGGDPLVMKTDKLKAYIEPLLSPELEQVKTIRIGTKALAFHPERIAFGIEADQLLDLSEKIVKKGKHLAYMLHCSHPRELEADIAQMAISRLLGTGAQLRSQAPIIKHINDQSDIWANLWQKQVNLGIHPYYMFIERDTGAHHYFSLPLIKAYDVYREAYIQGSGLCRTARGPVMSATPGKVQIDGVLTLPQGKALSLKYIQAREPQKVGIPFLAKWNPEARWWSDLTPYSEADKPFFEAH